MAMTILDALKSLDSSNDEHWTAQGLARLDVLTGMVGSDVARRDVIAAAPEFTRENRVLPEPEAVPAAPLPVGVAEAAATGSAILKEALAGVREQIGILNDQITTSRRRIGELETEEARIDTELQKKYPEPSEGAKMKRHNQRQHEIRLEQAARRQQQFPHAPAGPASPLDAALGARARPFQQVAINPAPKPKPPAGS